MSEETGSNGERTPMRGADPHARRTCGAKTRSGRPCANTMLGVGGRCRMHGGTQPTGIASPNYRHGKRQKYKVLPPDVLADYRRALRDPELLSLEQEVTVLDGLLLQAGRQLAEVNTPPWGETVELLNDVMAAFRKNDADKLRESLAELNKVAREGAGAARSYAERRAALCDLID